MHDDLPDSRISHALLGEFAYYGMHDRSKNFPLFRMLENDVSERLTVERSVGSLDTRPSFEDAP